MSIIKYTSKERDLLARIMRAEALGEGSLGMLMVGNVVVNRALADCLTFKNIRTINDAIYQNPGGFSGVNSSLFNGVPTKKERELADRIIAGEKFNPASYALWFYSAKDDPCKNTWWDQTLAGKYKNHCFYKPTYENCKNFY